ncbi:MAG TPA: hypothetical protein VH092_02335 [Urbifossiella sp.]|nr:hypothetical protein [Urbifossiella sp.]
MPARTKKRLNFRFALLLAGSVVAAGVGIHFTHKYQIRRGARDLLAEAARLEQTGEPVAAAEHLERYLLLEPDDAGARARYGLLVHAAARTPKQRTRAYLVLSDALYRTPGRVDLLRVLAPLAAELGQAHEARGFLADLRRQGVEDADLFRQQARLDVLDQRPQEAEKWYGKAVAAAPADPGPALELAALLRVRLNTPALADLQVDRLYRAGGADPGVRLAVARYYRRWGALAKAEEAVTDAAGGARAGDAETLLLAADVARELGKPDATRRHLDRGAAAYPHDLRFASELAVLDLRAGQREQALARVKPHLSEVRQPGEAWRIGNLLIDAGEFARAEELISRLGTDAPPWAGSYLRGRLLVARGARVEARAVLEQTAAAVPPPPAELVARTYLLLADCHARLANPERQVEACRKAVAADPQGLPARRALAAALVAAGDPEGAIREYREAAARSPDGRVELARLLVSRTLRQPPAGRRWEDADEAIKAIPPDHRAEAQLLRAEVLAAQDKGEEARRLAEAERDRDPKQVGPWLFLIGLAERGADPTTAAALAAAAEQQAGPRAEWVLARARLSARAGGADAVGRLAGLEADAERLPAPERRPALIGLAEAYFVAGDSAGAGHALGRAAGLRPDDPEVPFRQAMLAAGRGDEARVRALVVDLGRLEGAGGPLAAFAEAAIHLRRARGGDRAAIPPARELVGRAAAARPGWPNAALAEAELYDLEGDPARAVERYEALAAAGRAPLAAVRRLVQLLADQGRYTEARAALARLPEPMVGAGGLARASAQLALLSTAGPGGGARARRDALDAARKTITPTSDFRDHLWLGEMALLAGEPAEAEQAFRKARDQDPAAPEARLALVLALSRTDPGRAAAELEAARGHVPASRLPLLLAAGYEALGRAAEAGEQYAAAAAARPADPVVLRTRVAFLMRTGDLVEAEKAARQLVDLAPGLTPPAAAWARRSLAVVLATRGGFDRFREANALAVRIGTTAEDQWARALALAAQPGRRKEAIDLLEKGAAPASAPREALFLLARLHDRDGRWDTARAELLNLVRGDDRAPAHVAYYAAALIRRGQAAEADAWVQRLVKATGETPATVELRARALAARKQSGDAARVIREYAAAKGAAATLPAAGLLDGLDLTADAEQMYRAFAAESKAPTAALPLAGFLARRGRLPEALTFYEAAWKTCPPEAVGNGCVGALRAGKAGPADAARVAGWLDAAVAAKPQAVGLLILKADLYQLREQFAEAADLYRQILRRDPKQFVALNNLAFLLAVRDGQAAEALSLIDAGLAVTGPHPELLDTRGVVLTRAGRADDAAADLQRAVAEAPSGEKYFHLTLAHLKAGRKSAAVEAYQDATDAGLTRADLHPLERSDWDRLAAEVAPQ